LPYDFLLWLLSSSPSIYPPSFCDENPLTHSLTEQHSLYILQHTFFICQVTSCCAENRSSACWQNEKTYKLKLHVHKPLFKSGRKDNESFMFSKPCCLFSPQVRLGEGTPHFPYRPTLPLPPTCPTWPQGEGTIQSLVIKWLLRQVCSPESTFFSLYFSEKIHFIFKQRIRNLNLFKILLRHFFWWSHFKGKKIMHALFKVKAITKYTIFGKQIWLVNKLENYRQGKTNWWAESKVGEQTTEFKMKYMLLDETNNC